MKGLSLVKLSSSRQPLRCPYLSLTVGKELGMKVVHLWLHMHGISCLSANS